MPENGNRESASIAGQTAVDPKSQQTFDITPFSASDPTYESQSFGIAYKERYEVTNALTDLQMAIEQSQEAFTMSTAVGVFQFDKVEHMNGNRYDIVQFQRALDATPSNDLAVRAYYSHRISISYLANYRKTKKIGDLEMAIQHCQESLELTPDGNISHILRNLATAYHEKYKKSGERADLEIAIQQYQKSVDATPNSDEFRRLRLENLGAAHRDRYQETGDVEDIITAIQRCQEGLDLTPSGHSDHTRQLRNLGVMYVEKYQKTAVTADKEAASAHLAEALAHLKAPPIERWRSGRALVQLYAESGNWPLAYSVACASVALIPQITPRSLQNSDKQSLVTEVGNFATEAAAIATMADRTTYEAVRLLEQGRGLITGSLGDIRANISDLQRHYPDLAAKYDGLRSQLGGSAASTQSEADKRYEVSKRLDRMIHDIRQLPDFDAFLTAPSENQLKAAAAWGPVVIINTNEHSCDAFIVEESRLQTLHLPLLQCSDIRAREKTLESPDTQLLQWLWETTTKPVLDVLGFVQTPEGSWPRIWWIPTGPLAKFPIHAAGRHSSNSSDAVFDRVISSYSTSVQALLRTHQHLKASEAEMGSNKAVLVGMQNTLGQSDLKFAREEVDQLECLCRSNDLYVCRPEPFREGVLSALRDCKIFHYAGHGQTDALDPSQSALLVHDGPITLAKIFEANFHQRGLFLAYLSACGTGQVNHDKLLNEGLHLIGGCQAAGFRHVIGSLWRVDDKSCVDIAIMTYEWIFKHGMSDEAVSEGLHHASRSLRDKWISENREKEAPRDNDKLHFANDINQQVARDTRDVMGCEDTPLHWVPYVHFGI